ncbi:hypothetical protein Q671_00090 [Halomonas sp. PBN3]|nr:hypothetical protein Q671_00090 [Halomonas sp. PBN3]
MKLEIFRAILGASPRFDRRFRPDLGTKKLEHLELPEQASLFLDTQTLRRSPPEQMMPTKSAPHSPIKGI